MAKGETRTYATDGPGSFTIAKDGVITGIFGLVTDGGTEPSEITASPSVGDPFPIFRMAGSEVTGENIVPVSVTGLKFPVKEGQTIFSKGAIKVSVIVES